MMRRIQSAAAALLVLLLVTPIAAWGQARVVTGKATSNVDGQPLTGVSVRLRGAVLQTTTDNAGQYRLEVPVGSAEILMFSKADFDNIEKDIAGQSKVDVVLVSSVRYNQYGVKVDRRPVYGEDRDGILVFESPDLNYRFWFDMRVNVDGALVYDDKLNATGSGVEIRRARMAMKAQFRKNWYGEVDMDFGNSNANLEDAYLMWSPKDNLDIRWGNFKETFSMEQTTSSRYNTFLERPMSTSALSPSRRVGTEIRWRPSKFLIAGGVHFQDIGDADVTLASKNNNKDLGVDEGFALTGKIVFMPMKGHENSGIHLGLAASRRTPMTEDVAGQLRFNTRVVSHINKKKYIDSDYIKNIDHEFVTNAEFAAFHNGLKLSAEATNADVLRTGGLSTASFGGQFVQAAALLFGGKYIYNSDEGEFTENKLGRSWGDVEVAARYEYLDMNSSKAAIMGGSGEAWTLGLNLFPNRNVKFMLNWSLVNNDRYANGRGKLYVGHDAKGLLTKNPLLVVEPDNKGGEDFKVLGVRVQVSF